MLATAAASGRVGDAAVRGASLKVDQSDVLARWLEALATAAFEPAFGWGLGVAMTVLALMLSANRLRRQA